MPQMIFAGDGDHAISIKCPGLQIAGHPTRRGVAAVTIADAGQWTIFLVDGAYRVYAARQRRQWQFIATDPGMGDYIMALNPANCRPARITLDLPETADGRHNVIIAAPETGA